MSAFVVDHATINKIVTLLATTRENHLVRPFTKLGYDPSTDPEHLGNDLLAMNQDAVLYRYPDCDASNLPGPIDPPAYAFGAEPATEVAVYKAACCLRYQCSEGDVPDTELYQALDLLSDLLAYKIVSDLPEYETAPWG